jgi:hypothetical protein
MMTRVVGIVAVSTILSAGCVGTSAVQAGAQKGPAVILQVKDVKGKLTTLSEVKMRSGRGATAEELRVIDGPATLFIPLAMISKVEVLPRLNEVRPVYSNEIVVTLQNGEIRKFWIDEDREITGQCDLGRYSIWLRSLSEITNVSEKPKR